MKAKQNDFVDKIANWPVVSVKSISIANTSISARPVHESSVIWAVKGRLKPQENLTQNGKR